MNTRGDGSSVYRFSRNGMAVFDPMCRMSDAKMKFNERTPQSVSRRAGEKRKGGRRDWVPGGLGALIPESQNSQATIDTSNIGQKITRWRHLTVDRGAAAKTAGNV